MAVLTYSLTYAGIPFLTDVSQTVRIAAADSIYHEPSGVERTESQLPAITQEPLSDLIDELNRLIPFDRLSDFVSSEGYAGRKIGPLEVVGQKLRNPSSLTKIGEWYYPVGASRWSVFRGLMTSRMVKEVLRITQGRNPATLTMKCVPISANNTSGAEGYYTLQSPMYLLPPRPLGECGFPGATSSKFDGLYLVTLVDERYFGQYASVQIHIDQSTTWSSLVVFLSESLGYPVNFPPTFADVYGKPDPDSPLWTNYENASFLLDSVANNVGCSVVRSLQGTIDLFQHGYSRTVTYENRNRLPPVTRLAGGDLFQSGTNTAAGDLTASINAVLPDYISVLFPKYVYGPGAPRFLDPRGGASRPSAWYELSYHDVYSVDVPLLSGGLNLSGQAGIQVSGASPSFGSGITGVIGIAPSLHTTAKALYSGEIHASGDPLNLSGIRSLAMQVASDYFSRQVSAALDEVYPGTYAWTPEGIHDIIWTYSERSYLASTRVMRTDWNVFCDEYQYTTPVVNPATDSTDIAGVGGHTVAQSWRDFYSGEIVTSLASPLPAGQYQAEIVDNSYLPFDQRWKGIINGFERVLFEGTSGGTTIDIVKRGIDGTRDRDHEAGETVRWLTPNTVYGVNLVTAGAMQQVAQGEVTSGGLSDARLVPQTQTVLTLSSGSTPVNGLNYYSGRLDHFFPQQGFQGQNLIWVAERNNNPLLYGKRYDGQFGWYSQNDPAQVPVYLVTEQTASLAPPISGFPPPTTSGLTSGYIPPSGEVPPSGVYPPSYPCNPVYVYDTDVFCISGVLKLYKQRSTLGLYQGCLTSLPGNWYFVRDVGCCDCPTPPPPEPCVPGTCEECSDPPNLWEISIDGFTGLCSVFNRVWFLEQDSNCVWSSSSSFGGTEISVVLTVAGGIASLALTYGSGNDVLAGATYYATITDYNCCRILTFLPGNPADCRCGGEVVKPNNCSNCIQTPTTWSVTFSGGTNCFSAFNGNYVLSYNGDCIWISDGAGGVNINIGIYTGAASAQFQTGLSTYANYSGTFKSFNCCSPITLFLSASSCPAENLGDLPAQLTFIPNCTGSGGDGGGNEEGVCPATITGVPTCCNDSPVECSPIPCEDCVDDTPISWSFSFAGLTGDCAAVNGDWTVYQLTSCDWRFTAENGSRFRIYFPSESSVILEISTLDDDVYITTTYQGSFSGDCCSAITLTLTLDQCGGFPGTLTITPYCCNVVPEPKWWCVPSTGSCVLSVNAPPGEGVSGPWDTEALCMANPSCSTEPPTNDCCPAQSTDPLYATFSGSLAPLGTVQLDYDAMSTWWEQSVPGCGSKTIIFECNDITQEYTLQITSTDPWTGLRTSCDPFVWTGSSDNGGPSCTGSATVTITSTPP